MLFSGMNDYDGFCFNEIFSFGKHEIILTDYEIFCLMTKYEIK